MERKAKNHEMKALLKKACYGLELLLKHFDLLFLSFYLYISVSHGTMFSSWHGGKINLCA